MPCKGFFKAGDREIKQEPVNKGRGALRGKVCEQITSLAARGGEDRIKEQVIMIKE